MAKMKAQQEAMQKQLDAMRKAMEEGKKKGEKPGQQNPWRQDPGHGHEPAAGPARRPAGRHPQGDAEAWPRS
jgi:hypothetical protein